MGDFGISKSLGTPAQNVGYTSYSMLLTQTASLAPSKVDLSGNCSGITFSYLGVGYYMCTGIGLFTLNKTQIFFGDVYNISSTAMNNISVDKDEFNLNIDVASWKLKAVLTQLGLIQSIEEALNILPEPSKSIALIAWDRSSTINSESEVTKFVQEALQLNDEDVYNIFISAESLTLETPSQNRMSFKTIEYKDETENGVRTIYKTVLVRKKNWFERIFEVFENCLKRNK